MPTGGVRQAESAVSAANAVDARVTSEADLKARTSARLAW